MKFWPQDWQNDAALQSCCAAARGVWMELISIAHFAEPYGHVLIAGRIPSIEQISQVIRCSVSEVAACIDELEKMGVCNRSRSGAITSRRMIRDAAASSKGRDAVAKRGKQPNEKSTKNEIPSRVDEKNFPTTLQVQETEAEAEAESKRRATADGRAPDPMNTGMADIYPDRDTGKPSVAGWDLQGVFDRCMDAARINPARSRQTWEPVVGWLAAGFVPEDIARTIKRIADRASFQAVSLRAFDKAIREDCVPELPVFVPECRRQA